jgi:aspartyl-tRNA(Asn)/glutamyl-tRNA(Gln) amidotransferase subunit A
MTTGFSPRLRWAIVALILPELGELRTRAGATGRTERDPTLPFQIQRNFENHSPSVIVLGRLRTWALETVQINRRKLLANAVVAVAGIAAPSIIRAQTRDVPPSSRDRLELALARIADPNGEGKRACLTVYTETARATADAADARARNGISLGPLDGKIVSIKDLFDVVGEPTRAGSTILANAPPAAADAPVVRRLRAAGAVIVAKTNMPEFAYSIFGYNPHYGTPGNPADRARDPGGSSSGAAVAVADGMCEVGIGSDTGGSCRAPAAFCGTVGYKPSKYRVPTEGVFPLSYTMDSIGPLAKTVADCAAADAVMAGEEPWSLSPASLLGLRLVIPQGNPLADLDVTVSARFSEATAALRRAGARLSEENIPLVDGFNSRDEKIYTMESYAIHRQNLLARPADFDPYFRTMIEDGGKLTAADYIAATRERTALVRAMDARLRDFDALVLPTVAILAPTIAELSSGFEAFIAKTVLAVRNTAIANFFDLCAISIPLPRQGGLPVGLMLVARNGEDRKLFRMAAAIEKLFTN